jgi:hypothetical protein
VNSASVEVQHPRGSLALEVGQASRVQQRQVLDTALVLAVLTVSGNPAAFRPAGHEATYAIVGALFAAALLLRGGGRAVRAFAPIAAIFAALSIIQAYSFSFFPVLTVLGFLTRLFIGMAVVVMVADFARAFVRAMFTLSALSFIFWIPEYLTCRSGAPFHRVFANLADRLGPQSSDRWALGLHTYVLIPGDLHRNAGMFWEPGAFAGYLILALLMLAAIRGRLTRKKHLTIFCVLSVALISTFSTTGYIAYPIAVFLNFVWSRPNRARALGGTLVLCILAPVVIAGSAYAFTRLAFLEAKVKSELKAVQRHDRGWQIKRTGTLLFDWEYVSRRPLTGWGLHQETRFALHPWLRDESFGNGMSDFIVKFGVIGFVTFLLCVARGAKRVSGQSRVYVAGFLGATLVVLQGEGFLGFPLFLSLMFLEHSSAHSQIPLRRTIMGPLLRTSLVDHSRLRATEF